jgi:hypothetical protein
VLGPVTVADLDVSGQIPTIAVADEGSLLTAALSSLNFAGAGVTASQHWRRCHRHRSRRSTPGSSWQFAILLPELALVKQRCRIVRDPSERILPASQLHRGQALCGCSTMQTIGNVYSMFIATVDSSDNITATVATASSSFTTTATGIQLAHILAFASPVTLSSGNPLHYCPRHHQRNRNHRLAELTAQHRATDMFGMPQRHCRRCSTNVEFSGFSTVHGIRAKLGRADSSGESQLATNSTGNYALGMRAQL